MSGSVVDIPDQFQLIDSRQSLDVTKVQIEEAWKQQVRGTTLICVYFFPPLWIHILLALHVWWNVSMVM